MKNKKKGHQLADINEADVTIKLNNGDELPPTDANQSPGDEKRTENWSNQFEFLLACVGYSVGLGNVWRFGYLCSKSGGGAFLVPYFLTLLIVAVPLMYMEFSVGQFTQRGPIGAMGRLCPLLKGTGVATVVISFFLTTYYVVIIAWDLYFLISSFAAQVPWKTCTNEWNSADCWDGSLNASLKFSNDSKSPSEEFFRRKVLNESESMEDFGTPKLDLVLLVLLAWIIIYFCIWKGVKSTGKIVYVTVFFPYVVLVVILIRGVTLDGAAIGLRYFLVPKWSDLAKPHIWANAAIQNFNSIGVAFGGLISMASYNKRNKRNLTHVFAISLIDAVTSILCGCTVFSVMGYIAKSQSKNIEEVIKQGPGLIFMVLPEALRNMSWGPFWSILFFLMIFMLGIDSQFTMVETVITAIEDEFGTHIKRFIKRREMLVFLVCFGTFFLSFPNLCPGGIFYFTILDFFSAGISVFYIAFFEIAAIVWVYGANRLARNIRSMNGEQPNIFFKICWYGVTPLFILTIWALNWYKYEPISYGTYQYNAGAMSFGWMIALVSIMAIPLGAVHSLYNSTGKTLSEKFQNSIQPTIADLDLISDDLRMQNGSKSVTF